MGGSIAYYITAHGYGQGVRSLDAIRALMNRNLDVAIHLVTSLPKDFLLNRLPRAPSSIRAVSLDVGMVQLDSVRVDVEATLERVLEFVANQDELRQREVQWQEDVHAGVVVCDIPSIPLEAARQRGIPALALGNFSWDWIYEPFAERDVRWRQAIDFFKRGYREADLLIRIPFAPPMDVFSRQRDIALLSQPGQEAREAIAESRGCDPAKPWILSSFTSLNLGEAALERIRALDDWEFFTVKPMEWGGRNLYAIDREEFSFDTLLASCDAVLTKPGYGILSECVVNQKPIIYTEREDFAEYPILEAGIKKHLKHVHIPGEMLYAGDLKASLMALGDAPEPQEPLAAGGDEQAADIIIQYLGT
jgi:L-arabinokinase